MKPGIYEKLPFREYLEIDALNFSTLKFFKRTPLHARHDMMHSQPDKKELVIGHATHSLVLEPETFWTSYAIFDDTRVIEDVMLANSECKNPRATKLYKDRMAVWDAEHAAHCKLMQSDVDTATAIRSAIMGHPIASQWMAPNDDWKSELTLVWEVRPGVLAKCRIDRLIHWNGSNCAVDLKTWNPKSRDAVLDERSIANQIGAFAYHQQAAWYLDGLKALAPAEYFWLHVWAEQEAPHDVVVSELEQEDIEIGRKENDRLLDTYLTCKKTGKWPGYSDKILSGNVPAWMRAN